YLDLSSSAMTRREDSAAGTRAPAAAARRTHRAFWTKVENSGLKRMVSAELVPGWGGTVIPPAALTAATPPQPRAAPASTPTRPRARPSARNMAVTWERLEPKVRSVPI